MEMLVTVGPFFKQVLSGERVPSSGHQLGAALEQGRSAKDKTILCTALPLALLNVPLGLVCFSPCVKKINKD